MDGLDTVQCLLEMDPPAVRNVLRERTAFSDRLVLSLLNRIRDILLDEPNLLFLESPVTVCGDIHGQLFDLFTIFDQFGDPPSTRYLFLGDYVDRGHQSILTFLYVAYLKVKYPSDVFLLRGNHETRAVSKCYGFQTEILNTYSYQSLFEVFNRVFDSLPLSAIIDRSLFCVHGGICPQIRGCQRLHTIQRERPSDADLPAIAGLLWSDPEENVTEWKLSARGAGCVFGRPQVDAFLAQNRLQRIVRSHQVVQEGFRWYFEKRLALVWSAPNYGYKTGNKATVLQVASGAAEPAFEFFEEDPRSAEPPAIGPVSEYFA